MMIRSRHIAALGLAAALAAPGLPAAAARARTAGRRKPPLKAQLRTKLQRVFQQIHVVKSELHKTKQHEARVTDRLQESRALLELAQRRLRLAKEKAAAAQQAVAAATQRLRSAEQDLARHQKQLSRRIAANYTMGTVTYADVLFGARSLSDFLDRQYLVEKVLDRDVSLLRALRAAQARVVRERAALEQKRVQLAAAQQAILEEFQNLTAQAAAQARLLAQVQDQREAEEQMLDELEEDSSRITAQIQAEQRRRALIRVPGPALPPWQGHFRLPANGPITSGFGYRMHPILGYRRFHSGLDIGAGFGAPVYAADSGEILTAGFYRGYGRCIIILHGGVYSTLYGHLSATMVRSGQRVERGQWIGRVGSTGLSTGPHLHFEVRRDGVPVNPAFLTTR